MFSSFAQFLPSAIQNTISHHAHTPPPEVQEQPPPQSTFDPNTDDEGDEEELIQQQSRQMEDQADSDRRKVKSKKEKDTAKMATETFIFVRPPPSKTNHPLNLQVQLVPPNARPPSGVQVPGTAPTTPTSASSFGSTSSSHGESLSRSSSRHSDYSAAEVSTNNSTTSFASVASSTASGDTSTSSRSGSSGRSARRIIPLYNLQAHNVMTNVIADAGTDAKIAKFQKKGLELIDLAVLEPVEVWGIRNKSGEKQAKKEGMKISVDEMGAIVHTGLGVNARPGTANGKGPLGGFLQPKPSRDGSRPPTGSANSSALSLNSTSTNVSQQPQLVISPPAPAYSTHPPASAPPVSGTFPSSQLPRKAPTPPMDIVSPIPEHPHPQEATPPSIVVSTTPIKRSSAANLFGKFKFGSKRNSSLNPLSPPSSSSDNSPISPPNGSASQTPLPPEQQQKSDLARVAMAPMVPHAQQQQPFSAKRPSALKTPLSPSSITSQNSNTPTPTPLTPWTKGRPDRSDDDVASPTPTSSPARTGFMSSLASAATSSMNPGAPPPSTDSGSPRVNIGNALSKGKNRLIGGLKGAATAPIAPPEGPAPPSPTTGAKGFFNKIAAGITGNGSASDSASVGRRSSGLFSRVSGDETSRTTTRESVDSSGAGHGSSRLLHHTSSQQFIGGRGTPTASGASSVNPSPRPSEDRQGFSSVGAGPSGLAAAAPSTPAYAQSFVSQQSQGASASVGQLQLHPQQLSLRQLQLRPPVLGIQPTYVSASQTYAQENQGTSAVSLTLQQLPQAQQQQQQLEGEASGNGELGWAGVPLTKVESWSSLGQTEESVSGTGTGSGSVSAVGSKRKKRAAPSLGAGNDAADDGVLVTAGSKEASQQQLTGKEKERALMYVWLVAKWLKKRERGGHLSRATSEHTQGASESSGPGGRARDLFRDILPGRDRDREGRGSGSLINGIMGGDRESKRGSWHAGAGIGLIPSLGALHHHQPSTSSIGQPVLGFNGQPLVFGPVVGGGFEVRFEWKRAKTRSAKAKSKEKDVDEGKRGRGKEKRKGDVKERDMAKEESSSASGADKENTDTTPRLTQGPTVDASPRKMSVAEQKKLNRASTASIASLSRVERTRTQDESSESPSRASSRQRRRVSLLLKRKSEGAEDGCDDDEDEESDSEDSETPWVCTLKVRRIAYVQTPRGSTNVVDHLANVSPPSVTRGGSSTTNGDGTFSGIGSSSRGGKDKDQVLRLKVGTLSPTPHHPKVVAMLKVPFPLPDVEVERMKLVKRKAMMFGQGVQEEEDEQGGAPYNGLMLTAEDIKDVVCSTGLWLVVREGFGGVGKVNRKGDGWKIRG